mgnify:CR=1 FL=1
MHCQHFISIMKNKDFSQILSRQIALNIWNKVFFEKKTFNSELDHNKSFNNLQQRDKAFI